MTDNILKYRELSVKLSELTRLQCLYANSGLERLADEREVEEFKRWGIYSPNNRFPADSKEYLAKIQVKMYETTSQLNLLYEQITEESFEVARNLQMQQKEINRVHKELKEVLAAPRMPTIRPSDIQDGILSMFRKPI